MKKLSTFVLVVFLSVCAPLALMAQIKKSEKSASFCAPFSLKQGKIDYAKVQPSSPSKNNPMPSIDGSVNPQEVPDVVAYSLLFRFLSGRKTKEEQRNALAYIRYKDIGDPQQLLAVAEEYKAKIDDLQRRSMTVIAGKEQIIPSTFEREKFAIVSDLIGSLPARLRNDNGFEKLRRHINEGIKPKVKIFYEQDFRNLKTTSPISQLREVSFINASQKTPFFQSGGATITNYGDAYPVNNTPAEYFPDFLPQNTLTIGVGVTETNFYHGQPNTVKTDVNSPDGRSSTNTTQGTTYTQTETALPLYDDNYTFPPGDGVIQIPIYHSVFYYGYGPQCYQYGTDGPCPNYFNFFTLVEISYTGASIVYSAYRYLGVEDNYHVYGPTCIATFPCTKTKKYQPNFLGNFEQCRGLRLQIFGTVICASACTGQETEGYCT